MSSEAPAVVAVDVGSLRAGNFAWHSSRGVADTKIDVLVQHVAEELGRGSVALGFECPTWVPVPAEARRLGSARATEPRNRAWSAGAGAASMATGLAQICWILREMVGQLDGPVTATVRADRWRQGPVGEGPCLLLWEALVTGRHKGADHRADAELAAASFRQNSRTQEQSETGPAFNLLAAAAKWAGLRIQDDEVGTPGPIYGAGQMEEVGPGSGLQFGGPEPDVRPKEGNGGRTWRGRIA